MPITKNQRRRRQRYLGASDTPVIVLGEEYPYRRRASDVYYSKVGELPDDEITDPSKSFGNWLETPLLDWAATELGVSIIHNQFRVCHEGPGAGILAASHDALVSGRREGMEAKFVGVGNPSYYHWGEAGTSDVPMDVVVQVQQQMAVSNLDRVWVTVGYEAYNLERRLYYVDRDEEIIDGCIDIAVPWWKNHVEQRVPPTDAPPPLEFLKRLGRPKGSFIEVDATAAKIKAAYERACAVLKRREGRKELAFRALLEVLDGQESAVFPDGSTFSYAQENGQWSCDRIKLWADLPKSKEYFTQGTRRVPRFRKAPK